jgi:hypothetical protein
MESREDIPDSKRLLPNVVDDIATNDPNRICFSFPRSNNLAEGFDDMTFRTVRDIMREPKVQS